MLPSAQRQQRQLPGPTCMHNVQQPSARAIQRRISRQLRRSWAGTSQPCCHSRPHHHRRAHKLVTSAAAFGKGEVVEVKELKGVRIVPIELGEGKQRPEVQYLISWKDGLPDTWCVSVKQPLRSLDLSALQWLAACTCIRRSFRSLQALRGSCIAAQGRIASNGCHSAHHRTAPILLLPETPGCHMSRAL